MWTNPHPFVSYLPIQWWFYLIFMQEQPLFYHCLDMDLICHAHTVVEDRYKFWNDCMLVAVFSAPNYCSGKSLYL